MVGIDSHKSGGWRRGGLSCENGAGDDTHLALLLRYLDVCNQVMAANRHRFPYRQIWSAGEDARSGNPVLLLLVEEEVKAAGVVTLGQASITVNPIALAELDEVNVELPRHLVEMRYVLRVVSAPDLYVADPSQINWDWLQA